MPADDPSEYLREILALCAEYQQTEEDEEDLLQIEQIRTLVQKLLAAQQKQQDELMQGKMSPKALRGALGAPAEEQAAPAGLPPELAGLLG